MWALTVSAAGLLGGPLTARRPVSVARAHVRAVATSPELPTADRKQAAKERLNIRIDDEWYDLTNWRMAHPAGAHWIDAFKNADATEVRPRPQSRDNRLHAAPTPERLRSVASHR